VKRLKPEIEVLYLFATNFSDDYEFQ
jgi:hypothetical protein